MSEQILSAVHGVTTMLFGIYCSAFFLGIKPIRKNILTMFLLFLGQGLLYVIDLALFGETLANMSYPLIVHFPLVLFLSVHYKYPLISSAVSVFSAYLCCQISNWTGLFALAITGLQWCYYSVRILTTTLTFVLLYRYVFRSTKTIFTKNARELSIIGFLPFVYYVFDYAFTKFSTLLYSGNKAQEYIHEINSAYDETIIAAYSGNEMLNSVLSIYHSRFTDRGLSLICNVSTGKELPCSDLSLCTILSNALENSMHALEQLESPSKWARLTLSQKKNHILFQLENPVEKIPAFVDGVPVSTRNGHGIGVRSIIYYVEQLHGQCHFSIVDHCFVLRIII